MNEVSLLRLYLLRGTYLFIAVGLAIFKLPGVIHQAVSPDGSTQATVYACMMGIIVPIAMPWSYVFAQYVRKPGNRWRNA